MDEEKIICPCCGADLKELINAEITKRIRRINIAKAQKARRALDPKRKEELQKQSAERLSKWRKENPEKSRSFAIRASHARNAETFARQAQSIKDTARRKALKFAELLTQAQQSGRAITPEVENELLELAQDIVKKEVRAERLAAKKRKQK